VEEKLLVNRYNELLDVSSCEKLTNLRYGSCCRSRAKVRRLADLTSRFILSLSVGMGQDLGKEQNGQNRQSKSKHPDEIQFRPVTISHLDIYTSPIFHLTLGRLRCEQPHRWFSPEVRSHD
jgi:hypothetical protein